VVDACEIVVLSTRPADCLDALNQLHLREDQNLVSVAAGVGIDALRAAATPGARITRAMPVNSAEVGASPTVIFPATPEVLELFSYCGKSIPVPNESAFEQASVQACAYSWYFELFEQLIACTKSKDLPPETAKQLVLGFAEGAVRLAQQDIARSPGDIAETIATPGTFSRLGLDQLKQNRAFDAWRQACQLLRERLKPAGS